MTKRSRASWVGCGATLLALGLMAALVMAEGVNQPTMKPTAAAEKLFAAHVRSILEVHCVKCHGGEKTQGELDLTTRDGLLKGGENGPVVTLGKGSESRIYKLITHAEDPKMPKKEEKL